MSTVNLRGTLTVPDGPVRAALARAADVTADDSTDPASLMREILPFGFDVWQGAAAADGELEVSYYERWGLSEDEGLETLAAAGVTGWLELSDSTGDHWKLVLAQGKVAHIAGEVFYEGDPDPTAPVIALNRAEATLFVKVLAGETPEGVSDLLSRLNAVL